MTDSNKANKNRIDVVPGSPPVVFMFKPTRFVEVPADRVKAWEKALITRISPKKGGMGKTSITGLRPNGIGSWCGCPNFDDCDEV